MIELAINVDFRQSSTAHQLIFKDCRLHAETEQQKRGIRGTTRRKTHTASHSPKNTYGETHDGNCTSLPALQRCPYRVSVHKQHTRMSGQISNLLATCKRKCKTCTSNNLKCEAMRNATQKKRSPNKQHMASPLRHTLLRSHVVRATNCINCEASKI